MPKIYDADKFDWYWQSADGARVYSSARQKIVKPTDKAFKDWQSDGTNPSSWPLDENGSESDTEFAKTLAQHGLTLPGVDLVPESVTRAQAKIALLRAGLLDKVKEAVAKDPELQIWFEDAQTWERQNPHVLALGAELVGDDPEKLDELFIAAGKIAA